MSNKTKSLDYRMKEEYEFTSRHYLTKRVPVIIRIDGKAFHSFCKGMKKPFDWVLTDAMSRTMTYLVENIQGCVFAYRQSDEISLLLIDYKTIQTDAWFDYNIQKISSIAASMATMRFNEAYREIFTEFVDANDDIEAQKYRAEMTKKFGKACFDARAFNIPKEEVCNYFIWRQQDATRNSISSAGQAYFSPKQLHKKNSDEIQDMLFTEKGINWNDYPTENKRGICAYRVQMVGKGIDPRKPDEVIDVIRNKVKIDWEIPIFTQDREFVDLWLEPNYIIQSELPLNFKDKSGIKIIKE